MGAITKKKQPDNRNFRKAHRLKKSNEPFEQVAEKKCGECAKMRKRSDFSKQEWKKENGSARSCWSCSDTEEQAETKDCSKCTLSKVKSFFTKLEWANLKISVCNDCKREKITVKKVKAVEVPIVKRKKTTK